MRRPVGPEILDEGGFGRALRNQMNVIGALIMRELQTRFGRRNLGFVWLFVEPAILGLFVATIRVLKDRTIPGGINIVAFAVIGYVVYFAFRSIVSRAANAAEQNEALLWHARVTLEDILIARTILDTLAVLIAAAVFLVGIGIWYETWPESWVQIGFGIVMMGLLGHGVALIVLALTRFGVGTVERILHPLLYISIVFTGVFYMVWWLPKPFQDIVLLLPLVHIFEFVREGQFGPIVPYFYDLTYVITWIVLLNVYGGFALRAAKPHLEL
jgi:capsular polysaccharide transport system permease protein